jgi:hypothetical protein
MIVGGPDYSRDFVVTFVFHFDGGEHRTQTMWLDRADCFMESGAINYDFINEVGETEMKELGACDFGWEEA